MGPKDGSIDVFDVYKQYGDRAVLQAARLTVTRGEFLCLMGDSGSGKSTLLNLIAGIDRPDRGRITVFGQDVTGLSEDTLTRFRRNRIGFIFQFFNLLPNLDIAENVAVPLLLKEGARANMPRVEQVLKQVGLEGRTDRAIHGLSGGEQQRVAIARALVTKPELIIADEPTGSLDRKAGDQILALIREHVHTPDRTVIMVTHSQRVARTADRVLVIRDGRIESP